MLHKVSEQMRQYRWNKQIRDSGHVHGKVQRTFLPKKNWKKYALGTLYSTSCIFRFLRDELEHLLVKNGGMNSYNA